MSEPSIQAPGHRADLSEGIALMRAFPGVTDATRTALVTQLTSLMDDPDDAIPVDAASLAGLMAFLQGNPGIRHPNLSMDLSGRLVASWAPRARTKLSMTFTGTGHARWMATDPEAGIRDSGDLGPVLDAGLRGWMAVA